MNNKKLNKVLNKSSYIKLFSYTNSYKIKLTTIVISNILLSLSSVFIALMTKQLIDFAINSNFNKAIYYASITGFLFIFQLSITSFISIKTSILKETMRNNIQLNFMKTIYKKKWIDLSKYQSGDLITRITSDTRNIVDVLVDIFPKQISLAIQLIFAFIVLSRYDKTLSFLAFIVAPIAVIVSWLIGKRLKPIQTQVQTTESELRSYLTEAIQNFTLIRTFEYDEHSIKQINATQEKKKKLIIKKTKISALANAATGLGYRIGFFGAIGFGSYRLFTKAITFGTFTAFLQLVGQIQAPIQGIARTIPRIIVTLASVERIDALENLKNEIHIKSNSKTELIPTQIQFENIGFNYNENNSVLKNVSLTINKDEKIAFLGLSGEGKTTIIRLLLSLIEPHSGNLYLEFNDNSKTIFSKATRKYFSYVPQVNILFSGTIKHNLQLAKETMNPEDIKKALDTACVTDFINDLPNGINTVVGERGIGLSQGQIQRICIARALIHGSPFLILDEATSALDIETEKKVIDNLNSNYKDLSIIAVTHRDPIIKICDSIYVLNDGILTKKIINKKIN